MNRNSKKGFTIVELIIVIAVIAVLAAVLIPTFSNLIQKANEAKDTALVSNLNKAVAMDTTSHDTMYDVLKVAEDVAGINVAKINAAANSNEILWDSVNKCFVYRVGEEIKYIPDTKTKDVEGNYDYWKISSNQEDVKANKYSIYWTGAALSEITATTGFDAGEAEIGKIIYQREDTATAQTVTIRTNGGELEVSAKPDTVYHYDVASKVVVTKVHNASYHENGTVVGNLEVKEGHVELGAKADVSTVIVAPTTASAATVTVTTGATVGVVAATTEAGKTYLDTTTTVPADKKADKQLEDSVLNQFAGGIGTEASPYLIADKTQLVAANGVFTTDNKVYFKQVADIDIDRTWSAVKLYGEYDGNNYTVTMDGTNGTASVVAIFAANLQAAVSNLKIVSDETCLLAAIEYDNSVEINEVKKHTIYVSEITSTVKDGKTINVYESNAGFLVYSHVWNNSKPIEIVLKNCTVNASAKSSSACLGGFIGGTLYFEYPYGNTLEVSDCTFKGNLYGQQVGLIFGNGTNKSNDALIGADYKLNEQQQNYIGTWNETKKEWKFGNDFFNGIIPKDKDTTKTFASIFDIGSAKLKTLSEKYTAWTNNKLNADELSAYLKDIGLLDKIKLSNIDASEALFNGTEGVGIFSKRFAWNDKVKIDTMAQALLEAYYSSNVKGNYTTRNDLRDEHNVQVSVGTNGNFYLNTSSLKTYNDQYTYKILVSISGVSICKNQDLSDNYKSLNGRSFVASLSTSGFDSSKKWNAESSFAYNEKNAQNCGIEAIKNTKTDNNDPIFENSFRYKVVVDVNNYYIVLADVSVSGNEYSQPWFDKDTSKAKISLTLVAYENGVIVGSTGIK